MLKIYASCWVILSLIYEGILLSLNRIQRKKPLPKEVDDIYSKIRYKRFLRYKNDQQKASVVHSCITTLIYLVLIHTSFFSWLESFTSNPYILCILTFVVIEGCMEIIDVLFSYHHTFHIDEKYNMNRNTKKKFFKDKFVDILLGLTGSGVLYLLIVFFLEHYVSWTKSISIGKAIYIELIILCIVGVFIVLFSWISYVVFKKRYEFHDLEEGELRSKIIEMMRDSKKKVKKIQVYNESKVSTKKNAFLLKFLWIKEFGIADNFLLENSEEELLGVLAHEIGHLKHKKNIYNYIKYGLYVLIGILFVLLLSHSYVLTECIQIVTKSMNVRSNNYYVFQFMISFLFQPIVFLIHEYFLFVSRQEEYEADQNAVANGYGDALIEVLKEISKDELVDVNPHRVVEILEYDHPGMYRRILAMEKH